MYPLACIDSFNIPLTYLQTQVMDYDGLKFNLLFKDELVNYEYVMLQHTVRAGSRTIRWTNGPRAGMTGLIAKQARHNSVEAQIFYILAMPF